MGNCGSRANADSFDPYGDAEEGIEEKEVTPDHVGHVLDAMNPSTARRMRGLSAHTHHAKRHRPDIVLRVIAEKYLHINLDDRERLDATYEASHSMESELADTDDEDDLVDEAVAGSEFLVGSESVKLDATKMPPPPPKLKFDNRTLGERMPFSSVYKIKKPRDLQHLVKLMKRAGKSGRSIKAMGTQYAFSNVTFTHGWLIGCSKYLRRIDLPLDTDALTGEAASMYADGYLLKCEAGVTYQELAAYLWPPEQWNKTKINPETNKPYKVVFDSTGYHQLSLAGTVGCSAQGSGTTSMESSIRSIHLVTLDTERGVVQYQIEPAGGISNPEIFNMPDVELIQDDDVFNSVLVSMGTMGVIYAYTFEVRDAYYVKEHRQKFNYDELTVERVREVYKELDDGSMASWEVWVNPYDMFGKRSVVLGPKYFTEGPVPEKHNGSRGLGITGPQWLTRVAAEVAEAIANDPALSWLLPLVLDIALDNSTSRGGPVTLPAPVAMNFGTPNCVAAKVAGAMVGVDKPESVINAVQTTTDMVNRLRAEQLTCTVGFIPCTNCKRQQLVTSPFSLRIINAGRGYLSTQYGRRSCLLEMPIANETYKAEETLNTFLNTAISKLGGRPHWGLWQNVGEKDLRKLYPKLDKWVEVYARFNVHGAFSNEFTQRSGLDALKNQFLAGKNRTTKPG